MQERLSSNSGVILELKVLGHAIEKLQKRNTGAPNYVSWKINGQDPYGISSSIPTGLTQIEGEGLENWTGPNFIPSRGLIN